MSNVNIKFSGRIGSIDASNNKGVVEILAVSRDIQNSMSDLNSLPDAKKTSVEELIKKLQEEIMGSSELKNEQKEKALKQVKNLVGALNESSKPDFSERMDNAITMIKGLVSGVSGTVAISELLSKIASLFI